MYIHKSVCRDFLRDFRGLKKWDSVCIYYIKIYTFTDNRQLNINFPTCAIVCHLCIPHAPSYIIRTLYKLYIYLYCIVLVAADSNYPVHDVTRIPRACPARRRRIFMTSYRSFWISWGPPLPLPLHGARTLYIIPSARASIPFLYILFRIYHHTAAAFRINFRGAHTQLSRRGKVPGLMESFCALEVFADFSIIRYPMCVCVCGCGLWKVRTKERK